MAEAQNAIDSANVTAVLSGNRDAFARLVERYLPMVHALVRANLGAWDDVDDVAQDAFLSAYQSLDTLREPAKFAGWLASIVRHACVRHTKTHQRVRRNAAAWGEVAPTHDTDDPAKRELHRMLEQAVRELDVQHREILLLYYFSKKNLGEIELVLGIPREAAKKRLQRARAALETHITGQVDGLLDEYAPRKEQAARVTRAIAIAQPAWYVASNVTANASAATAWGTWIMNTKSAIALGIAAAFTIIGLAAYSYGLGTPPHIESQHETEQLAHRVAPQNEMPSNPVGTELLTPNQVNAAVTPVDETVNARPPTRHKSAVKSTRTTMAGGNPQRTGYFDVPAPLQVPNVLWAAEMNGEPGTMPVVDSQGRVFVSHGKYPADWLSALSPDGQPLWNFGPVIASRSLGVAAVLPDGNVAFAFSDRTTRAFDPSTGEIVWASPYTSREPLIDTAGNIYTSSRAGLEKVDAASGTAQWTSPIANTAPPATLSLDERTLYARNLSSDAYMVTFGLQAMNTEDGDIRWNFKPEVKYDAQMSSPDDFLSNWATPVVGSDGTVFIQDAGSNVLYAIRDNGDSASQRWEYWPAAAYADNPYEVTSEEFYLYNSTGDSPRLVATDGEAIYIGVYAGRAFGGYPASVHAVDMDGHPIWHTSLEGDAVAGSPVVTKDAVYVLGGGDNDSPGSNALYCLNRDNGQILWHMNVAPPHGDVGESIALGPDGAIYVATSNADGSGSILRALR